MQRCAANSAPSSPPDTAGALRAHTHTRERKRQKRGRETLTFKTREHRQRGAHTRAHASGSAHRVCVCVRKGNDNPLDLPSYATLEGAGALAQLPCLKERKSIEGRAWQNRVRHGTHRSTFAAKRAKLSRKGGGAAHARVQACTRMRGREKGDGATASKIAPPLPPPQTSTDTLRYEDNVAVMTATRHLYPPPFHCPQLHLPGVPAFGVVAILLVL